MLSIIKRFFGLFKSTKIEDIKEDIKEDSEDEDYSDGSYLFSTHKKAKIIKLQESIQELVDGPRFKKVGMDGYSSSLKANESIGNISEGLFSWFSSHGFIGFQICAVVYQHWLVAKACSVKAEDAARHSYNVSINDGNEADAKLISKIKDLDIKYKVKANVEEASRLKECFGIRHILFKVKSKDKKYYELPFNPDGIKKGSYQGMVQIDPYWITPFLSDGGVNDPTAEDFYNPEYWSIAGKKYHKSHFVIITGKEVPDILKPSYQYAGVSLSQQIIERVYGAERCANEGPMLLQTKRLTVRNMDLKKALGKEGDLRERLQADADARNNYGVLIAGKEETVTDLETALGDVDKVTMNQYQLVAAIANVPATRLLETSPTGFNSTGEYEDKNYQNVLATVQELDMSPIVEMHHTCMARSDLEMKDVKIDIKWNSTSPLNNKEKTEVQKLRSESDQILSDLGAIDAYDVRDRLITDEDSGYSGIESIDRPEEPDLSNNNDENDKEEF